MAKGRKVTVLHGEGSLTSQFIIVTKKGSEEKVEFKNAIIAVGFVLIKLPFVPYARRHVF